MYTLFLSPLSPPEVLRWSAYMPAVCNLGIFVKMGMPPSYLFSVSWWPPFSLSKPHNIYYF